MFLYVSGKNVADDKFAYFSESGKIHVFQNVAIFNIKYLEGGSRMILFQHGDLVVSDCQLAVTATFEWVGLPRVANVVHQSTEDQRKLFKGVQVLGAICHLHEGIATMHDSDTMVEIVKRVEFALPVDVIQWTDSVYEIGEYLDLNIVELERAHHLEHDVNVAVLLQLVGIVGYVKVESVECFRVLILVDEKDLF